MDHFVDSGAGLDSTGPASERDHAEDRQNGTVPRGWGKVFASMEEVKVAYDCGMVDLQATCTVHTDRYGEMQTFETTVGRVIFNRSLPKEIPFINGLLKKRGLQDLVAYTFVNHGNDLTVRMLDELKEITFAYATRAGISIGVEDMVVPKAKDRLLGQARKEVVEIETQRAAGVITAGERHNKIIDIWHRVTEKVSEEMFREMREIEKNTGVFNPINLMADSGARGSREQVRQLAGMRGLMSKPSGEVIEQPITANFREGLTVLQYFISTHGARKGLADTALKTADSGFLTRRLVDVAQDVIISLEDCQTLDGIYVTSIVEGGEIIESLRDRIVGRVSLDNVKDPLTGEMIVGVNEEITEGLALVEREDRDIHLLEERQPHSPRKARLPFEPLPLAALIVRHEG